MQAKHGTSAALLVDKPAGITSHDVVARIRRDRGQKTGHAGTLDPFATGLLILLLGRATRLQRYLLALPKTYVAVARLGWRSSTGDRDGELGQTGRIPERLELPTGRVTQRVPMTSAVKVAGERLYRKARRGEELDTPAREVEVHRAKLVSRQGERASFEIECSSGTYVRTLIETLEDAYCESLRRIAIGPFSLPGAVSEELSVEELMSFMPERPLDTAESEAVGHGRPIPLGAERASPQRLTHAGRLVAVARVEAEKLRPEVVLG